MKPRTLQNPPQRWKIVSLWLLTLSLIPLSGLIIAIAWGLHKGSRTDVPFKVRFRVSDYRSLTTYLTIIGVFHSFVNYCLQQLASRAATQIRTRAFLDGASYSDLLNTLPGSPDWKIYGRSKLPWKFLVTATLYTSVGSIGGVLYKQGLVLSTLETSTEEKFPFTYMTNCTHAMDSCSCNRYLQYGVAMMLAKSGGGFSKGIETIGSARRVTYVAAPTSRQLTSANANTTRIRAKSLAIVAEYRNITAGETLPTPQTTVVTLDRGLNASLAFYGTKDLDWSVSVGHDSTKPYQTVRGKTQYCVASCEWSAINGTLSLQSYNIPDTDCIQLDLGFWSVTRSTGRVGSYGGEMGFALTGDLIDGNWNSNASYDDSHDVLQSAFVVPAMYAVLVLGNFAGYYHPIWEKSSITSAVANSPTLNGTHYVNTWTIETKFPFVIYLVILLVTFIAHWVSGFIDRKTYVTEWAPLWFGVLSDSAQERVREQIRKSKIFESKGLDEIGVDEEVKF